MRGTHSIEHCALEIDNVESSRERTTLHKLAVRSDAR